jgi:hypothetical protein
MIEKNWIRRQVICQNYHSIDKKKYERDEVSCSLYIKKKTPSYMCLGSLVAAQGVGMACLAMHSFFKKV